MYTSSDFIQYLLLAIFGGIGVIIRFFVTMIIPRVGQINLPILLVNIVGSFLIGLFYTKLHSAGKQALYLWAAIGFCGGMTTFASFTLDVILLLQQNEILISLAYVAMSLILCLVAVWLGTVI